MRSAPAQTHQSSLTSWLHQDASIREPVLSRVAADLERVEVLDISDLRILSRLPQFDMLLKPVTAAKIRSALGEPAATTAHIIQRRHSLKTCCCGLFYRCSRSFYKARSSCYRDNASRESRGTPSFCTASARKARLNPRILFGDEELRRKEVLWAQ